MKHKANGRDCFLTEMVRELLMKSVYEITHWFEKRVQQRMPTSSGVDTFTFGGPVGGGTGGKAARRKRR